MGIQVPGDIMGYPRGVSGKGPGLGSHIAEFGEMTGVTDVAVVGVILVADSAGCPSGMAIFPWRSLSTVTVRGRLRRL